MTKFVVYRKPEVDDRYYDEHPWERTQTPYESRSKARKNMPSVGSEVGEGYSFRLFEFEDDEEIPSTIDVSEVRKYS